MVASSLPWFTVELDPFPNVEDSLLFSSPRTIQVVKQPLEARSDRTSLPSVHIIDSQVGICEKRNERILTWRGRVVSTNVRGRPFVTGRPRKPRTRLGNHLMLRYTEC